MFGIANQLLAVLALALVTTWMINSGRGKYAWVTILPMIFVTSTTLTAGSLMTIRNQLNPLNLVLVIFVMVSVVIVVLMAVASWLRRVR
jgi:carbon starvation protein